MTPLGTPVDALCLVVHHFTTMRHDRETFEQVSVFLGKLRTTFLPNFIASLLGVHVAIFQPVANNEPIFWQKKST